MVVLKKIYSLLSFLDEDLIAIIQNIEEKKCSQQVPKMGHYHVSKGLHKVIFFL